MVKKSTISVLNGVLGVIEDENYAAGFGVAIAELKRQRGIAYNNGGRGLAVSKDMDRAIKDLKVGVQTLQADPKMLTKAAAAIEDPRYWWPAGNCQGFVEVVVRRMLGSTPV